MTRKQSPNLDWQIAESEADWERRLLPDLPEAPAAASRRLRQQRYLWGIVTLLLLLTTGGSWWWRTRPGTLQQVAAEGTAQAVASVVTQQPALLVASAPEPQADPGRWLWHGQEVRELSAAVLTAELAAQLGLALDKVDVYGERAMARAVMYAEHGEPTYRQTRFYRRTNTGWVRTEPDATLWGPERSLDTLYMTFHYRQQDALAVIAVAPQMNKLYAALRRNLGLPNTAWAEKLVIDVRVTQPPGQALRWSGAPKPIVVPSPAVYLAPVELTDAGLLAQSIALPLIDQSLAQAGEHHAIGASWQPLIRGLRLWHVWDQDLPLAAWRAEVVPWLYTTSYSPGSRQPLVLPDRYTDLCAIF